MYEQVHTWTDGVNMHQFSNSFILYILKKYIIFLTEYANLYLKRMKIFFFKKNHDFNALRRYFFQTESTKEKKMKNTPRWRIKKMAKVEYSFTCTYWLVELINVWVYNTTSHFKLISFRLHWWFKDNIHITTASSWNHFCFVMNILKLFRAYLISSV